MEKIKIQFGCGNHKLNNWVNLDLPECDVTLPLKFQDQSVDFVFHEHLIEHLDEVDGFNFMNECYRILKQGGVMRVSCPSIDGFIKAYQNWEGLSEEYKKEHGNKSSFFNNATLRESANYIGKKIEPSGKISQISNSDGWHKFLYSESDISEKLTTIGFKKIVFCQKHQSEHQDLVKLERRFGWGIFSNFPEYIDLTVEAQK